MTLKFFFPDCSITSGLVGNILSGFVSSYIKEFPQFCFTSFEIGSHAPITKESIKKKMLTWSLVVPLLTTPSSRFWDMQSSKVGNEINIVFNWPVLPSKTLPLLALERGGQARLASAHHGTALQARQADGFPLHTYRWEGWGSPRGWWCRGEPWCGHGLLLATLDLVITSTTAAATAALGPPAVAACLATITITT